MRLILRVLLIISMAAGVVLAEELFFCSKCGYENDRAATECTHCKAAVSFSKQEPVKPVPAGASKSTFTRNGKLEFVDPVTVEKEIAAAKSLMKAGDNDAARLCLRNARGLESLTDPAAGGTRHQTILALIKECERAAPQVKAKCPVCDGSGKSVMKVVTLKGEVSYVDVPAVVCPKCSGKGELMRSATVDDLRRRVAQAGKRYQEMQDGRKFADEGGGVWVPAELAQKLSVKQLVAMKKAVCAPCSVCCGTGSTDCSKCNGLGEVKCTNKKCVRGMVEISAEKVISPSQVYGTEKCRVCGGSGVVSCMQCSAKGGTVCSKCDGTGTRPDCSSCSGKGMSPCSKCGGAGSIKDIVCATCGGDGFIFCNTCKGDGKAAK